MVYHRVLNVVPCVYSRASQLVLVVKNSPANASCRRCEFNPWVRKIPQRRVWQPTPVFLPGESHGQRSLGATVYRVTESWRQLKRLNMLTRYTVRIVVYLSCL